MILPFGQRATNQAARSAALPQRPVSPQPDIADPLDRAIDNDEARLLRLIDEAIILLHNAATISECSAPRQGRAGILRAALCCATIASDYRAAEDYGPSATADEILRYIVGELAVLSRSPHPRK